MKNLYSIMLSRYWLVGVMTWFWWMSSFTAHAQISGFVFRDFNADGARTDTLPSEPGVSSITVRVFIDRRTQPISTTTSGDGSFTFSAAQVPPGSLFRLEFVNLPTGYFSGPHGSTSKTTVQFGTAPAVNMDAGINFPSDYCQANPLIVTPCYINGDPLKTTYDDGTPIPPSQQAGNGDVLVAYPFNATGVAGQGGTMPVHLAFGSETGALWGVAYQRRSKTVFSAAVIKRHTGLGSLGTGGIYQTNMTTNMTTPYLNLQSLGINTGPDPHAGLIGDKLMASYDSVAMSAVGRSGIGGMVMSDDDKMLYLVNLHEKRIYGILVNNPAKDFINSPSAPTAADTISWAFPDPGCVRGQFRPWALQFYRGKLYVGGVCSAENSDPLHPYADTSGLKGIVYQFDPTQGRGAQFTEVLSFPLSFTRGYADGTDSCANFKYWLPWTNKFPESCNHNKHVMWPQPIISDLIFDVDGSLIIGMMDRFGFLSGRHNFAPTATDNGKLYDGFASGDLLRAYNNNGTLVLENNGKAGPHSGVGANNGQGPGKGEFYGDDYWLISSGGSFFVGHDEIFNGGLAMIPGTGEVLTTAYDPITDVYQSGGIRAVNNRSGISNRGFVLYADEPGTFGKASGLGDLNPLCDPAPIEIGNRIWFDDNRNGIQDAYEKGIPNLVMTLHDMENGGQQVGQTTSSSTGEYYFNDSNVTPKLLANHRYQVRINPQQLTAFTPSNGRRAAALASQQFTLSPANQIDAASGSTSINSKGRIIDNYFVIEIVTTDVGENNHALDLSVYSCPILSVERDSILTCEGEPISNIVINGQYFARDDSVKVVYFDTPQSGTAVYSGGTSLGIFKPGTGGQVIINSPAIPPSTGDKRYYVYAILHPPIADPNCQPYAGSVIIIKPKLKVIGSSGTITCERTSLTMSSTVTQADGTPATNVLYRWSGPNSFSSSLANPVVSVAGIYTVAVTSVECPNAWVETEITIGQDKTPPDLQASSVIKACASCTVVVTASAPNANFTWSGPNGFSSNAAQFTTSQEGEYTVKATGITNSCTVNLTVSVFPPVCPIVQLTTPSTTICAGQPAPVLSATTTGQTVQFWASATPLSGSAIYAGSATSLGIVAAVNGVATLDLPGLYTQNNTTQAQVWYLYVTVPAAGTIGGGCLPADERSLVVNPLPIAPSILSVSAEAKSCSACSTTLVASVQPVSAQLLWTGPNGFSSTSPNPVVTPDGIYTLVVTTSNSCTTLQAVTTVPVVTKALNTTAVSICIRDTPYISYTVTGVNFTPEANSATLIFVKLNGDTAQIFRNQPLTGRVLYPGAAIDADGNPIDWPGWKFENGDWLREDDGLTPNVQFIVSINPVSNSVALYPPPSPLCIAGPPLGLGDFVWKDFNKNGIQDANEPGVPNVRVELYSVINGVRGQSPIKAQLTNATGKYLFDTLAAGDYQVRFVPESFPAGCTLTVANQGDDRLDSDADALGYSQVVTLDPNDVLSPRPNRTIDAGLVFVPVTLTTCADAPTSLTVAGNGQPVRLLASQTPLSITAVCTGVGLNLGTATVGANGNATLSTTALSASGNTDQLWYIYATTLTSVSAGATCLPVAELQVLVKPKPVKPVILEAYGGALPCFGCSVVIEVVTDPVDAKVLWTGPNNFTSNEHAPEVTRSGFFTVVATNTIGACSSVSDWVEVEVTPILPDPCPVLLMSSDQSVCSGSSTTNVITRTFDVGFGSQIRYVMFDQPQTDVETIYTSGTVVALVTPDDLGVASLTATNGLFINNGTTPLTKYIYTTVYPEPTDISCRPYASMLVQVLPTISTNLSVSALPPTCAGVQSLSNGQLIVSNFDATYRYSVASQPSGLAATYAAANPIPSTGIIASQLTNPALALTYYVRIFNASGCYIDLPVVLNPVNCQCPPAKCVPMVIKRVR